MVKIATLMRGVVLFIFFIACVAFYYLENHPFINFSGFLLFQTFSFILFYVLGDFSTQHPEAVVISFVLILFIQLRVLVLCFIPESFLGLGSIEYRYFNGIMGYFVAGTFLCFLGVKLGAKTQILFVNQNNIKKKGAKSMQRIPNFWLISLCFIFAILLSLCSYYLTGFSGSTGSGEHLGFFRRYVLRLIDFIPFSILTVVSYHLVETKQRKMARVLVIGVFCLFFLYYFLTASRGGVFEILVVLLSAILVIRGNFTLHLKPSTIFFSVILLLISLVIYPVASQLRVLQRQFGDLTVGAITEALLSVEVDVDSIKLVISEVSYRLSLIESTFYPMFAQELQLNDISDKVNIKTTGISSMNRIIPGKPFGNILFTEYAYGFFWYDYGLFEISDDGRLDMTGTEWSMFGISYQLFGLYFGVVFICFFTALLVFLVRRSQDQGGVYGYCFAALYVHALHNWVRNLGLDNLADRTVHSMIVLLIYLVFFNTVTPLLDKR